MGTHHEAEIKASLLCLANKVVALTELYQLKLAVEKLRSKQQQQSQGHQPRQAIEILAGLLGAVESERQIGQTNPDGDEARDQAAAVRNSAVPQDLELQFTRHSDKIG